MVWRRLVRALKRSDSQPGQPDVVAGVERADADDGVVRTLSTPERPHPDAENHRDEPDWVVPYRKWIVAELGSVRILDMTEAFPLADLYVPINLAEPGDATPDLETTERRFGDVEEQALMAAARRGAARTTVWDPEDALVEHRAVAVIGDPGAGKTTIVRRLATQLARGECAGLPSLPFVVDLHAIGHSDLVDSVAPERLLPAWISRLIEEAVPSATDVEPWVTSRLESAEAVLLLDGLDEVSDADHDESGVFRAVLNALTSTVASSPGLPSLITCRRVHAARTAILPKEFTTLETLDFEWEHISRFVESWFRAQPETGAVLKQQLQRNSRIRGLTASPLLLALVCITFQRRGSLPQRRADVYRRCVDVLLAEWDATRRRDRYATFTLEHKEDLLRRVAWHFHTFGHRYMQRSELLSIVTAFLPMIRLHTDDAEPILDEITAHHGLLKDFGQGWYGFHHFTIQEHFAVEQITSWRQLDDAIALRDRTWWREIIRLYAGKGDCTALACRLASEREDLFHSNLLLIGECLAEGSAVDPDVVEGLHAELTRLARRRTQPAHTRALATGLAMRLLSDRDTEGFVRWLTDGNVPVAGRLSVARHATHGRPTELREALVPLLAAQSLDILIREALATSLATEWGPDRTRGLVEATESEPDPATRVRLGMAMGHGLADDPASLLETALGEGDVSVRHGVALALGYASHSDAGGPIDEAIATCENELMRRVLGTAKVLAGSHDRLDDARELALSGEGDVLVRTHALNALLLRDRAGARELLSDLMNDARHDRAIRTFAARMFASTADEEVVSALVDWARNEAGDRFIRAALLEGAGESRRRSATGDLIALATDPGALEYVRRAAVDALGRIGGTAAADALSQLTREEGGRISARAIVALAQLGEDSALTEAVRALGDRSLDRGIRRAVAEGLRSAGTPADATALDQLCSMLNDTDIPSAMLDAIHRFASEIGRTIYPDEIGLSPITYEWVRETSSGKSVR